MKLFFAIIVVLLALVDGFTLSTRSFSSVGVKKSFLNMASITKGVDFDTVAREWRLKWSADDDKKSLQSVQQTLALFQAALSKVDGVKSVQRIVCGGCLDYKVIVALSADKFPAWESKGFAPESDFLAAVKAVPGVTTVETQTYTIETVV